MIKGILSQNDLQDFNFLNINYKWKLYSFKITNLDIILSKMIWTNIGGGILYRPLTDFHFWILELFLR